MVMAGDTTGTAPEAHGQMPCHPDIGTTTPAAPQADCPHCSGDAPLGQCQCCDQAAPAGVPQLPTDTEQRLNRGDRYHASLPDALPRSPGDRLYRPPIPSR